MIILHFLIWVQKRWLHFLANCYKWKRNWGIQLPIVITWSLLGLYQFLLLLNRFYANRFDLPFDPPLNHYAYQYKELLEKNISEKTRVDDYAEMMNISRVTLNKAVMREFGLSAVHLLKQRLLQEVKSDLLFTGLSVKEIAYRLHFSESNHLMRFFKQMTGQTISEFLASIKTAW